jgi:hypothetical protein
VKNYVTFATYKYISSFWQLERLSIIRPLSISVADLVTAYRIRVEHLANSRLQASVWVYRHRLIWSAGISLLLVSACSCHHVPGRCSSADIASVASGHRRPGRAF